MAGESPHDAPALGIPKSNDRIPASGGEKLPIRTIGYAIDIGVAVPHKSQQVVARVNIPYFCGSVPAGRGQPFAAGVESEIHYRTFVRCYSDKLFLGREVPHSQLSRKRHPARIVAAAAGSELLTVGTENDTVYGSRLTPQGEKSVTG